MNLEYLNKDRHDRISLNRISNDLLLKKIQSTDDRKNMRNNPEVNSYHYPNQGKQKLKSDNSMGTLIHNQPNFMSMNKDNKNMPTHSNKQLRASPYPQKTKHQNSVVQTDIIKINKGQKVSEQIMRFMRQQIQLAKNNHQNKFKHVLKNYSMELNKLRMKLDNNEGMLMYKDKQIKQLYELISNMQKQGNVHHKPNTGQVMNNFYMKKILDLEHKVSILVNYQSQLSNSMIPFSKKINAVEKQLLNFTAKQLSSIKNKTRFFIQESSFKIDYLNTNLQFSKGSKMDQLSMKKTTSEETKLIDPKVNFLMHEIKGIKQEILVFRMKQFKYENVNIRQLSNQLHRLSESIANIQFQSKSSLSLKTNNQRLKAVKPQKNINTSNFERYQPNQSFSNISNASSFFLSNNTQILTMMRPPQPSNKSQSSVYFDDYRNQNDLNSTYTQGQFFHPMSSSFQANEIMVANNHNTLNTLNQSFQNFTSDDEQEDETTQNQIRIMRMFQAYNMKRPVPTKIYEDGKIKICGYQQFLADENDKYLKLGQHEVKRLQNIGYIQLY